jgi:hypothetical protein
MRNSSNKSLDSRLAVSPKYHQERSLIEIDIHDCGFESEFESVKICESGMKISRNIWT